MANAAPIPAEMARALEALRAPLAELTKALQAAAAPAEKKPGATLTAGAGPGGAFAALSVPLTGVAGAAAGAAGSMLGVVAAVKPFGEALSPVALEFLEAGCRGPPAGTGVAPPPRITVATE